MNFNSLSIQEKWARAIGQALNDCPMSREEVARQMSDYLGKEVRPNILNAYASTARDTHVINIERLDALVYVTKDKRLVDLLAELVGCMAVPKEQAPYMEYAEKKMEFKKLKAEIEEIEEALND